VVRQALRYGLTPFVEVASEAEIAALGDAGECIVAVNTKDIRLRERGAPDRDRAHRLLPAVLATGTRAPVAASGIGTPRAAAQLLDAGYRGLLIGSALLRSASVVDWFGAVGATRRRREGAI